MPGRGWAFIAGEYVVRFDHDVDDDAVMRVVKDHGGRYVDCVYVNSGVSVAHPFFFLRSWQPTKESEEV